MAHAAAITQRRRDMARKVIDCSQGHASVKIYGDTDDELVKNASAHLKQYHPGLDMTRDQILAMATAA
jgi:hypothetical protein